MKNFILAICLGLSTAVVHSEETPSQVLNCTTRPGSTLCLQIDNLMRSYDFWCRGYACSGLWRSQIHMGRAFVDFYELSVLPHAEPDLFFVHKVRELALKICQKHIHGNGDEVAEMVDSYNSILAKTYEIQKRFKVSDEDRSRLDLSIENCEMNVN